MKIAVVGLWHLGCTIASSISEHFETIAYDSDVGRIAKLRKGIAPVQEAGLNESLKRGIASGKLRFSHCKRAIRDADVVWLAIDTPVDQNDNSDVNSVRKEIESLLPYVRSGAVVLVSSQVPVGFVRSLMQTYYRAYPKRIAQFAYSPENLRLGSALKIFKSPKRVIVGIEGHEGRTEIARVFAPFCNRLIWMSLESAEMTKHAINSFLGVSIAFANEIARLCERTGAQMPEVEEGMRSESRIGRRAYLDAGLGFSGGTLARDLSTLVRLAGTYETSVTLLPAAVQSNALQKQWAQTKVAEEFPELKGKRIAVLGLTYKAGTDTLRRSASLELCKWLIDQGALVKAYDPAVRRLPAQLGKISLAPDLAAALEGADALVVATEWPEFKSITPEFLTIKMRRPCVFDPKRHLRPAISRDPGIRFITVGLTPKPGSSLPVGTAILRENTA